MAVGIYKKDDDLNVDQQGAVPRPREYPWQALIYKRIAGQAELDRHETCQYISKPSKYICTLNMYSSVNTHSEPFNHNRLSRWLALFWPNSALLQAYVITGITFRLSREGL